MTFGEPTFLRIGAALALLVVVGCWSHARRRRALAEFLGGRAAAGRLSAAALYRLPVERALLLVVAALALAAAAAEPRWNLREVAPPPPPPARSVVLAVDVSASMQATDLAPTRLARAIEVSGELVGALASERVGLLLFAGTPYPLVPPTHDHAALRYFLDGTVPTIASAYDPGSLPSAALAAAATLVERGAEPEGARVVVLIGDGGGGETDATTAEAARAAREAGVTVHAVGVGTARGSGMVMPEAPYQLRAVIADSTGVPVVSTLRESRLRRVAEAGGGTYTDAADEAGLRDLGARLAAPAPVALPQPVGAPAWERFDPAVWLTAAALLALLLESLFDVRLPRRAPAPARRPA